MIPAIETRPMAILQVLPALVSGGVERGTLDIARALIANGHRALVASAGGPLVRELETLGAKHFTLPVDSKKPWTMWRNSYRLETLIRSERVDLVHARSRAPAWSCYRLRRRMNIPFVTTFHGRHGTQNQLKRWYNSVLLRADKTIAVSDFIAEHIHQHYPVKPDQIITIRRGIDLTEFDPSQISISRLDQLKHRWSINPSVPLILLPGRLTRLKGHSLFIEALSQLDTSSYQALIVGETKGREDYVTELTRDARNKGIPADCLKFVGPCQDMAAAYAISDIVVSASTQAEAFGRTLCEAQRMRCSIIATAHGGANEVVAPSQQPNLVEPGNARAMAEALQRCLNLEPSQKHTLTEQAGEFVARHFSLQTMADQTLSLYRSLTQTPPANVLGEKPTSR